jgi:cellulose biosynthesis protein BcsQ
MLNSKPSLGAGRDHTGPMRGDSRRPISASVSSPWIWTIKAPPPLRWSGNPTIRANLHLNSASYSLEVLERREEYRWAIDEAGDDVRDRLARALLSDYVKQNFDVVLIDAPPRTTVGFLNSLCAATHIFVPTVVDAASARAVGRFAQQLCRLVPAINPLIAFAGIIGT